MSARCQIDYRDTYSWWRPWKRTSASERQPPLPSVLFIITHFFSVFFLKLISCLGKVVRRRRYSVWSCRYVKLSTGADCRHFGGAVLFSFVSGFKTTLTGWLSAFLAVGLWGIVRTGNIHFDFRLHHSLGNKLRDGWLMTDAIVFCMLSPNLPTPTSNKNAHCAHTTRALR